MSKAIISLVTLLALLAPCHALAQDALPPLRKDRPAQVVPPLELRGAGGRRPAGPTVYCLTQSAVGQQPFVHTDYADLLFPAGRAAFGSLYDKLDALLQGKDCRVNILHIGGSHVQGGTYSHTIRTNLTTARDSISQRAWGAADRGMLFPFKAMKTNAPADYTITPSGEWTSEKNLSRTPIVDLGLTGGAVITSDPSASLSVALQPRWAFDRLRIVGEGSSADVFPLVVLGADTISPSPHSGIGYLYHLPRQATACTVVFEGLDPGEFTLRGLLPQSSRSGITYTASGINGASVPSWLRCTRFEEELALLPPDLVVFGIGINDASGSTFNTETFKQNYRRLIARIRSVSPLCAFLFITTNDCWRSKTPNSHTPVAERAFIQLAEETGGCVFNVFRIMGGLGSSERWVQAEHMTPDHVHFTHKGYVLLGNLLSNALISDFEAFNGRTH